MIDKKKIEDWIIRGKPPRFIKYEEKSNNWNTSKKKPLNRYYLCDYCKKPIDIKEKLEERDGGEFDLPFIRTGIGRVRLAVHQKCLNPLLKEVDDWREKRESEL